MNLPVNLPVNLLALDTAFGACSAAVLAEGALVSSLYEVRRRGHAERLLPMIGEVCEEAGLGLGDIDLIAVTRGPGTFAGVRIGLAVAKGLGLSLDRRLIAVGTLEAIAMNVLEYDDLPDGVFAVAHDARRGEVYLQQFRKLNDGVAVLSEPAAIPLDEVPDRLLPETAFMFGTGAALLRDVLEAAARDVPATPDVQDQPDAAILGRLAWRRRAEACDERLVQPLYIRPPDAVLPKPVILPFRE